MAVRKTPSPEVMNIFLKSMRAMNGEPRKLTKREEKRLEQARELEHAAYELRLAAEELEEQAARLRPKNMFPDSIADKVMKPLVDTSSLPKAKGLTFSIPKFPRLSTISKQTT
jgi:hypothetical protein